MSDCDGPQGDSDRARITPGLILAVGAGSVILVAWAMGRGETAMFVAGLYALTLGTMSAVASVRSLVRGFVGVDALASIAIAAALVAGEVWAAFIVGLMLATGEALERFANWRARKDLRRLIASARAAPWWSARAAPRRRSPSAPCRSVTLSSFAKAKSSRSMRL